MLHITDISMLPPYVLFMSGKDYDIKLMSLRDIPGRTSKTPQELTDSLLPTSISSMHDGLQGVCEHCPSRSLSTHPKVYLPG